MVSLPLYIYPAAHPSPLFGAVASGGRQRTRARSWSPPTTTCGSWGRPRRPPGLTHAEEMLIARCCPIMRALHLNGGQLGYGGHVVNVAQELRTYIRYLRRCTPPRVAADVPIITIRSEGQQEPGQHKDLHVRKGRVQRALLCLIANNPYYRDIVVDGAALSQLPVEGQLCTTWSAYHRQRGRFRA